MIVTELLNGNLREYLEKEKLITTIQRIKMAKQAALGINWLHSGEMMVIHRDLVLFLLILSSYFC